MDKYRQNKGEKIGEWDPQRVGYSRHGVAGRYWGIYTMLWRNSIMREMSFKSNFVLWIVAEMMWFALQLCFMNVLYSHTDSIAGWSRWEVVLLVGTSHLIQQLFTAVFLTNVTELSELIRTGRLDFLLLLPVNTRFLISFRKVDLGAFVNASTAVGVIIYALRQLEMVPSAFQVLVFIGLCLIGAWVHYSLIFLLSTVSFWTVRAQGIVWGYYNLFNIARLPDSAFRGFYKVFFTYGLPILLVSNVPAAWLSERTHSLSSLVALIGMGTACFVMSELAWRFSLKRYTSASS
jgi:ABC-2 type transport system permease protein